MTELTLHFTSCYLQGFVRMAIQHGAALVPIFAFGQAASFTWYRPGPPYIPRKLVEWVSRKAGALLFSTQGRSQSALLLTPACACATVCRRRAAHHAWALADTHPAFLSHHDSGWQAN